MSEFQVELLKLLQNVYQKYVKRKEERYLVPSELTRAIRGTISPVAYYFEDEFGRFLHNILDSKYRILIDYPLQFPGRNNKIKPDILILEGQTIKMILELKIDLGYEKKNWRDKKKEQLDKLERYKDDTTYKEVVNGVKEPLPRPIKVINNVPFGTVILSQKNGSYKSQTILDECDIEKCLTGEQVPYFHLVQDPKRHPNDFVSYKQVDDYFANFVDQLLDDDIDFTVSADWIRLEAYLRNHLAFKL